MVVSMGAAAELGMGWRQSWAGVSSGVGNGVLDDLGMGQQRSQGLGGGGFG